MIERINKMGAKREARRGDEPPIGFDDSGLTTIFQSLSNLDRTSLFTISNSRMIVFLLGSDLGRMLASNGFGQHRNPSEYPVFGSTSTGGAPSFSVNVNAHRIFAIASHRFRSARWIPGQMRRPEP